MTVNDEKITLSQLEQYLSKAAWILKGPVDASDFNVYIFHLLCFKRISEVKVWVDTSKSANLAAAIVGGDT